MQRKTFDIDWISLGIYALLLLGGWMAIYAVSSTSTASLMQTNHGKQLMWIGISTVVGIVILSLDSRAIEAVSYVAYGLAMTLLLSVFVIGREVNGAHTWISFGSISIQPSEFAKIATALALAKYMTSLHFSFKNMQNVLVVAALIGAPAIITLLQNDTGSALVFASFIIVLFREGLSPLVPITGLGVLFVCILTLGVGNQMITISILAVVCLLVFWLLQSKRDWKRWAGILTGVFIVTVALSFATGFIVSKLQIHQQNRIMVLFNPQIDPQDTGYNVIQSKIAIGSGGFWGKGFLQGNYTKYKFVPKQVTDFIFCTVGEEGGWIGTTFIVGLFLALILRLIYMAEHAKTRFARIYGYSAASIFFFHTLVNVGMTIGLVPVIGIPLPFFSYGGSALLAFSSCLYILINLYSYRSSVLGKKV